MATINRSLFPDQQETKEQQEARYRQIYLTLEGYEQGHLPMSAVKAIPKEEIREVRAWINAASTALVDGAIPDFGGNCDDEYQ